METRHRRHARKYTRGGEIQNIENNPTARDRSESSPYNRVRKKHHKTRKTHEGLISKHQYGRSHKTCISPGIDKLLAIQQLIQKKTIGIVFDNDTKGCYDRIVTGISLATLRRLGYSKESVRILCLIWAQMQHHICTVFGVSETTYGSTIEKLLYGIGQGSCASPILWGLLNKLILVRMERSLTVSG
jgi:hypothetical protein